MSFRLKITTGNPAFEDDRSEEIARILATLATKLRETSAAASVNGVLGGSGTLHDVNGGTVGTWEYRPEEEETWRQTACRFCGTDIEGDPREPNEKWTDRGGNAECATTRVGLTGQAHKPVLDSL